MSGTKHFTEPWDDYELIDAGGGKKLERWGEIITIRPEMQAYFHSGIPFDQWKKMAHWEFTEKKANKGAWKALKKNSPSTWDVSYGRLVFKLEITTNKHLGLFPEPR